VANTPCRDDGPLTCRAKNKPNPPAQFGEIHQFIEFIEVFLMIGFREYLPIN
jgi:hypothetical protein